MSATRFILMAASASLLAGVPRFAAADCADCGAMNVDVRYIHELWRNAQGGIDRDTASIGKLDVAVRLNGDRVGLPGLTVFARGIYDNAGSVSGNLTGDAQGVSNIEATSAARLFELWSEWSIGAHESLRVGLYDFNSEFDSNATGALFINPSHGIGKDISQSGRGGPSIFPVSSFGLRLRTALSSTWSFQTAALDGVPGDPDHPTRTAVHLGGADGALLAAEANRVGDRLSKLAMGTWYYTAHFDRFASDAAADADPTVRGSRGAYAMAEVQLYRPDEERTGGLAGFVRFGVADARVNRFGRYVGSGLVYTGVLMDSDQVGVAVAQATNGVQYRRMQLLSGERAEHAETNVELTWRFGVRKWLALQPDLQYIHNPNTRPDLTDALAIGLRFELVGSAPHSGSEQLANQRE